MEQLLKHRTVLSFRSGTTHSTIATPSALSLPADLQTTYDFDVYGRRTQMPLGTHTASLSWSGERLSKISSTQFVMHADYDTSGKRASKTTSCVAKTS